MIGECGIVVFQVGEGHPVRYRVMCGFREGFLYAHHAVCPAPPVARWLMDLSDMSYLEFISGKMCTIFALSDIPVSFNCVPLFYRYALIYVPFLFSLFVHLFLVQDLYSRPNTWYLLWWLHLWLWWCWQIHIFCYEHGLYYLIFIYLSCIFNWYQRVNLWSIL